jgi:hypothetical protein
MFLDIQIRQGSKWVSVNEEPDLFKGVESIQYSQEQGILKIVANDKTPFIRSLPASQVLVNYEHPKVVIAI